MSEKAKSNIKKTEERKKRAQALLKILKKMYPEPKSELKYRTNFQFLVAVILSAQATDKKVNEVTKNIFKKYKSACDFARLSEEEFAEMIKSLSFYRNKAKNIIKTAKIICEKHKGRVPKTIKELTDLPGVAYKTANVVLGELFDIWEGIAVDTHVRRFALKFDLCDSKDPNKIAKCLEELIPKKDWKYVNNGFVLYGRYTCPAKKHDCKEHPLTKIWPEAANRWPLSK